MLVDSATCFCYNPDFQEAYICWRPYQQYTHYSTLQLLLKSVISWLAHHTMDLGTVFTAREIWAPTVWNDLYYVICHSYSTLKMKNWEAYIYGLPAQYFSLSSRHPCSAPDLLLVILWPKNPYLWYRRGVPKHNHLMLSYEKPGMKKKEKNTKKSLTAPSQILTCISHTTTLSIKSIIFYKPLYCEKQLWLNICCLPVLTLRSSHHSHLHCMRLQGSCSAALCSWIQQGVSFLLQHVYNPIQLVVFQGC